MQQGNFNQPQQNNNAIPQEKFQQQLPMNQQQPLMMAQAPMGYQHQPQYNSSTQLIDSEQRMMGGNQQMMMNNQQMIMNNQQMIMGNQQMMMVPPGMVPPNPNFFGGIQCFYVTDPLAELANAKMASIKQRFEPWEVISGCETPNQYYVFVEDKEGRQKYLFKAKEESNCCCRNFCSGQAREFTLHVNTIQQTAGKEVKEEYARFHRPFKCTCCCLARPELKGHYIQKNNTSRLVPLQQPVQQIPKGQETKDGVILGAHLGKIVDKFTCCDPIIQIHDSKGSVTWTITGDCCQCGYFCRNSICGKCSEVNFEIYKGTGPLKGNAPGKIKKKFKGFQSVIGDADFFDLVFPETATPEERFMQVVAVIMLDYLYYEDKEENHRTGRRRRTGFHAPRIHFRHH